MTEVQEIAPGIHRISTFVPDFDLVFNQFLFVDDEPLLYHAGMRRMFPFIRDALAMVIDPSRLRWIGLSHFESDECGALNEWLDLAPSAEAVCTKVGAIVNVDDFARRPPRALGRKDVLSTGKFSFRMYHTPQLPHGWDAGMLWEETTRTLLCSDLFHHTGPAVAVSLDDPLPGSRSTLVEYQKGPLRNYMPYTPTSHQQLQRLADLEPRILAAMDGPAFICDGREALIGLCDIMREVLAMPA
jgi:flavorubredoxin